MNYDKDGVAIETLPAYMKPKVTSIFKLSPDSTKQLVEAIGGGADSDATAEIIERLRQEDLQNTAGETFATDNFFSHCIKPDSGVYSMPHFSKEASVNGFSRFSNIKQYRLAVDADRTTVMIGEFDKNIESPHHLKLVVRDETKDWTLDEVTAKAGKIFCTYLVDVNEVTHCCEVTPSYTLYPLYSSPENFLEDKVEREELAEKITAGHNESTDPSYVHCKVIDGMSDTHVVDLGWEFHNSDESSEEFINRCIEYHTANPTLETPYADPSSIYSW